MDIVNANITSIVPPAQDDNFCSQRSRFPKVASRHFVQPLYGFCDRATSHRGINSIVHTYLPGAASAESNVGTSRWKIDSNQAEHWGWRYC
jgi:hypothetical protein